MRVLDAYKTDPDVWRTRLLRMLACSGTDTDEETLAAARAVLRAERRAARITMITDSAQRTPSVGGTTQHNAVDS